MAKALNHINPATLHLLKKLIAAACDETRENLGQVKGDFEVDETLVLHAHGRVTVAKSTPDAVKAQSAKPWHIVHVLLTELNKERAAAKKTGITLSKVVKAAEALDATLATKAKKAADKALASFKEATRSFKWGGVSPKGAVAVLASGNNLEEEEPVEPEADEADESKAG